MTTTSHLWAVGYDDIERAGQVRDQIAELGWDKHYLLLEDMAVVARQPDGSFTIDRTPFPAGVNVLGCTAVGFIAGLVLGAPLIGAAFGAALGGAGTAVAATAGIDDDFVEDVKRLMRPGTSTLFVLDSEGDMDVILHGIRGLGGTVLKTNVDMERARLIQSTLAAGSAQTSQPGGD